MPLPIIAVVGRPNVGKSTFVNRIAQADEAIVHEMRGVTRDRSYHIADWNGVSFKLIDTGGIEMGDDDKFQGHIRSQALEATREADLILFLVDGKTGIMADDEAVARILQRTEKPVMLLVNKMDNPGKVDAMWEFYALGLGDPWPISATHGNNTGDLLDAVVDKLRELGLDKNDDPDPDSMNIAIIGRPNAGKSSLTNKLTNNERSIVSDVAGTTRDAIDTLVEHDGKLYTIVDTAGLRKKSHIDEDVEYACKFINASFKGVSCQRPQGTYMLFLDCAGYCAEHGISITELQHRGVRCGVIWQNGEDFIYPKSIRMNLALPKSRLIEAFDRLKKYVFI